jgi:integrase
MARVFKATYVKMRTVKDRKGRVVYDLKNGRKAARRAPVLDRDENTVLTESRRWYVEYKDATGKPRRKAGFTDRKATEHLAAELERTAEHVRSSYKPKEHDELGRHLSEHLAEFKADLLGKGTSARQAQQVHNRAKRIIDGCRFVTWSQLSATKVQSHLSRLRHGADGKRGISAQTSNWYLQAIKAFCAWLVRENRAPESPLAHLRGLNVNADRRHERRAPTDDECSAVLAATATGPERRGMSGPDRALLYRTALESGLRAGELRTLTVHACHLDGDTPWLTVKAGYSKHRKQDDQPIPVRLAEALAEHIAGAQGERPIFPTMPEPDRLAKVLRADLKAAGVLYRDEAGRVADFRALRHTYITNLARAGVHPKVAMDLARHSNINLTLAPYSHTLLAERAEAVAGLPDLAPRQSDRRSAKATGTYNGQGEGAHPKDESAKHSAKRAHGKTERLEGKEHRASKGRLLNRCTGSNPYPGFESRPLRWIR